WSVRATQRNRAGDHSGAIEDARRALEIDSSYEIPARGALAVARYALGQEEEAAQELRRAIDGLSDPDHPGSTDAYFIAMALLGTGREDEAIDLLEKVPPGAWLWFYLQEPNFDRVRDRPRFMAVERAADPREAAPGDGASPLSPPRSP
ncbi:MAG: hypothetical protein ACR2GQ_11415, partial [Gemmatimonadota bacterium]